MLSASHQRDNPGRNSVACLLSCLCSCAVDNETMNNKMYINLAGSIVPSVSTWPLNIVPAWNSHHSSLNTHYVPVQSELSTVEIKCQLFKSLVEWVSTI